MNKNDAAKALTRMTGFKKSGSFYIGTCNDSVIAGYGLDAPPGAIYIWRFALPSYDNIEFLHFGLGKRILTLPQGSSGVGEKVDFANFLLRDWSTFSEVNDCERLIGYINAEELAGAYALWARFLTHIRCKEFTAAGLLWDNANVAKKFAELKAISTQFAALSKARDRGGWERCSLLLDEWHRKTMAAFC